MGKCRSDRGTVLPSASFVPPGSTKAKSESGRLLVAWVVSCATTGFLSRPAAFSVPVDRYGFHRRRERLQCWLLAGLRGRARLGDAACLDRLRRRFAFGTDPELTRQAARRCDLDLERSKVLASIIRFVQRLRQRPPAPGFPAPSHVNPPMSPPTP